MEKKVTFTPKNGRLKFINLFESLLQHIDLDIDENDNVETIAKKLKKAAEDVIKQEEAKKLPNNKIVKVSTCNAPANTIEECPCFKSGGQFRCEYRSVSDFEYCSKSNPNFDYDS